MKNHFRGWKTKDVLAVGAISRAQTGLVLLVGVWMNIRTGLYAQR
tara:strand:+ start:463 stop:597 length:135 start_codon:yes stop_codon:yes gene_type:complete